MPSCCSSDTTAEDAGSRRKFFVIFLLTTMGLGFVMIIEIPRSLQSLIQKEMKLRSGQFELHYYLLFWPNILSWVTGFIIDRYLDLRLATVVFITSSCIGNTLYAIGTVTRLYIVLLVGWLITSLGLEASFISIACYTLRWFPKRLTNTVFAIVKSVPLLGGIVMFQISDSLMPQLSSSLQRGPALSIAVSIEMCLIVIPLISAVILAFVSKLRQTRNDTTTEPQKNIKMMDVRKFPLKFWFLSVTANIFFSSCFTFLRLNVLSSKYELSSRQNEVLVNGFYIGACFMGPIVGIITDWKGRNLTFITSALIGGAMAHFSFAFIITDPFYPMILLSLSYSLLIGSYWSLYPTIFKQNEVNAALAIDNSILMLFCAIGQGVGQRLLSYKTNAVEIFYFGSMMVGIIGSCVIWGLDCSANIFNRSKNIKEKRSKRMFERDNGRGNFKKRSNMEAMTLATRNRPREIVQAKKPGVEANYLRLKRYEAEGNMFKHQRVKRQTNRMIDRRKSKSNEEIYFLSSQV